MSYIPHTWVEDELITAEAMNHLEEGVANAGGGTPGVSSFNGRTGAVTPQAGDYTAAQVGARPDTWTPTAADVGAVASSTVTTIQEIAKADFDALTTKDPTTFYLVYEAS